MFWVFVELKKIVKIKNKFQNEKIEWFDFRYFHIRNFEIPKYRPFYIWSFQMLILTNFFFRFSEGRNFERRVLWNLTIANIKSYEVQLFDFLFVKLFSQQSQKLARTEFHKNPPFLIFFKFCDTKFFASFSFLLPRE